MGGATNFHHYNDRLISIRMADKMTRRRSAFQITGRITHKMAENVLFMLSNEVGVSLVLATLIPSRLSSRLTVLRVTVECGEEIVTEFEKIVLQFFLREYNIDCVAKIIDSDGVIKKEVRHA